MRNGFILSVVGVVVLSGVVGCKKKDDEAQTAGYQQQPYGQQQPGGYQQQPGGYQQQPGAQPTAQPTAAPTAPPAGGGQAQPVDPMLAGAATQILNQMATQSAVAGSKPVGSALAGNFQQGQFLESQIQLQPGKCYTVVASGLAPVSEVNVKFVAVMPVPGSAMILANDQDTGAQAVLGKKPNCYKNAFPMAVPVKLVLEVAGGSGIAAAQLYEK